MNRRRFLAFLGLSPAAAVVKPEAALGWEPSQAPSVVNDALREHMTLLRPAGCMSNHVHLIVSDYGEHPAPDEFVGRWAAARKRKDGRPDRRYRLGRAVVEEERALVAEFNRIGYEPVAAIYDTEQSRMDYSIQ